MGSPDENQTVSLASDSLSTSDSGAGPSSVDPSTAISQSLAEPSHSIGRYQVRGTLGSGGFGTVYSAYDPDLNRGVAVKVPNASHRDSKFTDVYLAEARTVAKLDHQNIVPVYDVGRTADGLCYFVSKLIQGASLEQRTRTAPPTLAQSVEIVTGVAEGLHHAHSQGLVHRDIKPANVLLNERDQPLIADFGLALADDDFGKGPGYSGTIAYMSPEQARGEGHLVDGRSDIYSLGVVLYELLTGKKPHRSTSTKELLTEIAVGEVRPPRQLNDAIPKELERICLKALSKQPTDRYSTAKDFSEDLKSWLSQANQATVSFSNATLIGRQERKSLLSRRLAIMGCLVAATISLGYLLIAFDPSIVQSPTQSPVNSPTHNVPASIDVLVWNPNDPLRRNRSLREPGTLPLKNGDQIRVEVNLEQPAYLYLVWIDGEGTAVPVYPWKPGQWRQPPPDQEPTAHLSLPETSDEGWPMQGASGMETLILFARSEPLPSNVDLRSLLVDLPKQPLQSAASLVWFADGKPLTAKLDPTRSPNFSDPEQIDDPILNSQRLIQERMGTYFSSIRAVSFAHE